MLDFKQRKNRTIIAFKFKNHSFLKGQFEIDSILNFKRILVD